jgi:predicted ribosomally synthesized peptide with nif11-like leader
MSNPIIQAFFKQVQTDESLRLKMRSVKATNKDEAAEALVQIAAEAGFEFTARQYMESVTGYAGPPPAGTIKPADNS